MCAVLNKPRFDEISCSGSSGTHWQYRKAKWDEIMKRLGTLAMKQW